MDTQNDMFSSGFARWHPHIHPYYVYRGVVEECIEIQDSGLQGAAQNSNDTFDFRAYTESFVFSEKNTA